MDISIYGIHIWIYYTRQESIYPYIDQYLQSMNRYMVPPIHKQYILYMDPYMDILYSIYGIHIWIYYTPYMVSIYGYTILYMDPIYTVYGLEVP